MKIYAISDTHFGHNKLVEYGRPADFTERLFKSISNGQGDILIHCGDFCIGQDEKWASTYMQAAIRFKHKILVRGNHDKKSYSWYYEKGFDHVCEIMTTTYFGKQLLFSHIPLKRDTNLTPYFAPVRNIHGHLHGNNHREGYAAENGLYDKSYHYDLAPELHDYKIINLEHLL